VLWLGSKNEADVGALVRAVGGTKAGISQHLAKLRLAGGTDGHRDGRRVLYPVADPHIVTLVHQGGEHILGQRAEPGTGRHRASRPVNVKDLKPTGTPS
jgi:DNA-binding transcriptional ArsR family regulator